MKPILLLCALLFPTLSIQAQSTYTEKLRKNEAGKGTVIINQSPEIERVVNHTGSASQGTASQKEVNALHKEAAAHNATAGATTGNDKNAAGTHETKTKTATGSKTYVSRARHKARGFRICIFTGGNSRADKTKAIQMGNKCREKFPELAAYPSFLPPRWVTHVGDFKTRQEAEKYVQLIRKARFTYEVRIVSSEVNIPY